MLSSIRDGGTRFARNSRYKIRLKRSNSLDWALGEGSNDMELNISYDGPAMTSEPISIFRMSMISLFSLVIRTLNPDLNLYLPMKPTARFLS